MDKWNVVSVLTTMSNFAMVTISSIENTFKYFKMKTLEEMTAENCAVFVFHSNRLTFLKWRNQTSFIHRKCPIIWEYKFQYRRILSKL